MPFTCLNCPLYSACKTPCAAVESMLPIEDRGEIYRLRRAGARANALDLVENLDDTSFLIANRHRLQGRLRQVFDLYYNEGLSHQEIARFMGLHRRSIGHLLDRARRVIVRLSRRAL